MSFKKRISAKLANVKQSVQLWAPAVATIAGAALGAPQLGAGIGNLISGTEAGTAVGYQGIAAAAAQGELMGLGIGPSGVFADIKNALGKLGADDKSAALQNLFGPPGPKGSEGGFASFLRWIKETFFA